MDKGKLIIRKIKDIIPQSTSHGVGQKKVLLGDIESDSPVTQIAIITLEVGESVEKHSHQSMAEHFLLLDGECVFTICEEHLSCEGGMYVLVPCGSPHSIIAVKQTTMLTIGIAYVNK